LKAWQAFHIADDAAPLLSKRFVNANFEFRQKFLNGQPSSASAGSAASPLPRAQWARRSGRDYVKLYYPAESKAKMDKLVADLRVAMRKRLQNLAWMSPAPSRSARQSLKASA
jgi:putative endopeptidase